MKKKKTAVNLWSAFYRQPLFSFLFPLNSLGNSGKSSPRKVAKNKGMIVNGFLCQLDNLCDLSLIIFSNAKCKFWGSFWFFIPTECLGLPFCGHVWSNKQGERVKVEFRVQRRERIRWAKGSFYKSGVQRTTILSFLREKQFGEERVSGSWKGTGPAQKFLENIWSI